MEILVSLPELVKSSISKTMNVGNRYKIFRFLKRIKHVKQGRGFDVFLI
jgi:hypothetical protein